MSATGTCTNGSEPTTAGTVSNTVSLLHVSGSFDGTVVLQVAPAGTTDYVDVEIMEADTATPINTPDTTALYRFVSFVSSGTATVYLGA